MAECFGVFVGREEDGEGEVEDWEGGEDEEVGEGC